MKLYDRQLNGLSDIRREKARLKSTYRKLKKGDAPAEKSEGEGNSNSLLSMAGSLLTPRTVIDTAMALTGPVGKLFGRKKHTVHVTAPVHKTAETGMIMRGIKEFAGGYIKWKLIELSYKGIKKLIQTAREKKWADKLKRR